VGYNVTDVKSGKTSAAVVVAAVSFALNLALGGFAIASSRERGQIEENSKRITAVEIQMNGMGRDIVAIGDTVKDTNQRIQRLTDAVNRLAARP
jgi:hypothetical protein